MLHRRGEGGFGSNVEGIKPIIFDVGKDERWKGGKSEEALKECHKQLGDNATIIYDDPNREPIEKWKKVAGAHWDCYNAGNFFGWEDEQVIIVIDGGELVEMITRAKSMLYIVLWDREGFGDYSETWLKDIYMCVKMNCYPIFEIQYDFSWKQIIYIGQLL